MDLTPTFIRLLEEFRCVFTNACFALFVTLVTGWVLSHRHRYVTDLILTSGSTGKGHFSNYHRFFSQYVWLMDKVFWVVAKLALATFCPTGTVLLAVDDTLCRKRGLTLYGVGMHHDPLISSRSKKLTSWGHNWVVVSLLVVFPRWAPTKVFALPIAVRLYRNRQGVTKGKKKKNNRKKSASAAADHRTRPELAVELLEMIASWFPHRQFMVTADSAYGGGSVLQKLPPNMELISHVHPKGRLYNPPSEEASGKRGRKRKKGDPLPGMAEWAADPSQPWQRLEFDQFGFHATVEVKTIQALYYTAGKDRLLVIVLVRDVLGKRPDQMFYCTRLDRDACRILSTCAFRWAVEMTFENSKQLLGFEDPANRTKKAVCRTAPMALVIYSLIVVWFHKDGHRHLKLPDRPWYRKKAEPSFADMLTTLRRISWEDLMRDHIPKSRVAKKLITQIIHILSLAG